MAEDSVAIAANPASAIDLGHRLDTGFEVTRHEMCVVVAVAGTGTREREREPAGGVAERVTSEMSLLTPSAPGPLFGRSFPMPSSIFRST